MVKLLISCVKKVVRPHIRREHTENQHHSYTSGFL